MVDEENRVASENKNFQPALLLPINGKLQQIGVIMPNISPNKIKPIVQQFNTTVTARLQKQGWYWHTRTGKRVYFSQFYRPTQLDIEMATSGGCLVPQETIYAAHCKEKFTNQEWYNVHYEFGCTVATCAYLWFNAHQCPENHLRTSFFMKQGAATIEESLRNYYALHDFYA